MAATSRPDIRRLLLHGALTTAACYLSLVLAYAAYRTWLDWLGSPVPRETKDAIKAVFPSSVITFGALFAVTHLASMRLERASPLLEHAGLFAAYVVATGILTADAGPAPARVLTVSWGILAGLLLVATRSGTIVGFLRGKWKQVLLAAASLFVSLELGLRAYYLVTYRGTLEDLHDRPRLPAAGAEAKLGEMIRPSLHRDVIYELKPGLDVVFEGARVKTNERGWREDEVSRTKPPGTRRVLGLGDSIMFGWGVEESERYLDRLEERLNTEFPGVRWETVVTAVPGYNLMNEVALLESVGLSYEPDLIVYGYCANDEWLPNFVEARRSVLSLDSFALFYLDVVRRRGPSLFATRIAGELATDIREKRDVPEEYRHLMGRDSFLAALGRLEAIGRGTGIPIIDFDFGAGAAHGRQVPAGIRYVNARDAVARCGAEFSLSRTDAHPSATGHRALADALYADFVESGIVRRLLAGAAVDERMKRGGRRDPEDRREER